MLNPAQIVEKMLSNDEYSRWLGIKVVSIEKGYCRIEIKVRKEMTNGFGILHGGIAFAFADSALAFASNSFGYQAVSLNSSIYYHKKIDLGATIFAESKLVGNGATISSLVTEIKNDKGELHISFVGQTYNTGKVWQ